MNFTVYSMDGCDYCDKVKQLMELTKQTYRVYTLDEHFTIEEFNQEFNSFQFPQVVVDIPEEGRVHVGGSLEVASFFKERKLAS